MFGAGRITGTGAQRVAALWEKAADGLNREAEVIEVQNPLAFLFKLRRKRPIGGENTASRACDPHDRRVRETQLDVGALSHNGFCCCAELSRCSNELCWGEAQFGRAAQKAARFRKNVRSGRDSGATFEMLNDLEGEIEICR